MNLSTLRHSKEDFSSDGNFDGHTLALHLVGNADMDVQRTLEGLLVATHDEARRLMVKEVTVNY